jgi:hypothetical protein
MYLILVTVLFFIQKSILTKSWYCLWAYVYPPFQHLKYFTNFYNSWPETYAVGIYRYPEILISAATDNHFI